jgi:subtilase family serine protease
VPVDLEPCETFTDTFDIVIECTGDSDTIRVCADNFNVVDELDETNNCLENECSCVKKPDLVITEKYETFVDGGDINITYKVNNIGGADAGPSNTTIYINGSIVLEVPTPGIPEGECHENTVGPFNCPCGETLNVAVCADNKDEVDESDERNNCEVNEVKCPPCLPDLVITDIWVDGNKIHYTIQNIGGEPAPRSLTGLWIDDIYRASEMDDPLAPGEESNGVFARYSYREGKIEVCADYSDRIEEIDETNNCRG